MAKYVIKTGESLTLELNVMDGSTASVADVASVSASLKKTANAGAMPAANAPKIAQFDVEATFSGWAFTLSPTKTAQIPPGLYIMDAKMLMENGEIVITDPVQIEVRGSVS